FGPEPPPRAGRNRPSEAFESGKESARRAVSRPRRSSRSGSMPERGRSPDAALSSADGDCSDVWRDAVVIVNAPAALCRPVEFVIRPISRGGLDLLLRDVGAIAAEPLVIGQLLPRQRVVIVTDPEK